MIISRLSARCPPTRPSAAVRTPSYGGFGSCASRRARARPACSRGPGSSSRRSPPAYASWRPPPRPGPSARLRDAPPCRPSRTLVSLRACVHEDLLASLSETETSQGLLAIAERPQFEERAGLRGTPLIVVAVAVQNPGNLGALLRTAEAAGATGAILAGASADAFSWKALRGSMGSAFRLPHLRERSVAAALDRALARGLRLVATVARGRHALRPGRPARPPGAASRQRGRGPARRRGGAGYAPRLDSRSAVPWRASTSGWPRASCSLKPPASVGLDPDDVVALASLTLKTQVRRPPRLKADEWRGSRRRLGPLFPRRPREGRAPSRLAPGRPHAASHPRRAAGPGRGSRAGPAPPPCPRGRPAPVPDPLGPARLRQDHPRPRHPPPDPRPLRGDERRALGGEGAARGAARGRGAAAPRRAPHGRVHRRDPPLQQGPAGRAPRPRRVGRHRPHRGHHREPLVRGERGPPVPLADRGAEAAVRGDPASSCCGAPSPTRSAASAASGPRWRTTPSSSWPRRATATRAPP